MNDSAIPDFATLAADPEIAALLDFEPVPVKPRVNGWDPDAQRAFIALLAITGSKRRAATAAGRSANGITQFLKRDDAESFRIAHDGALALYRRRKKGQLAGSIAAVRRADPGIQAPGQRLNELGEYEDEDSIQRRADEARDSISAKLTRIRRLYLKDISGNAGKRAAFEILTDLPIDWEKAALLEPQDDEPFRKPRMREPDMILAAEAGWLGDVAHGRNRIAERKLELRAEMDAYHAEHGLPPINWEEEHQG